MVVEALRLIVVLVAVVGANRLATSNPHILGSQIRRETAVLVITILGAGVAYIAGGVIARAIDRLLHRTEERVSKRHASEIIASTLGLLIGALVTVVLSLPVVFFASGYVALGGVAAIALVVMS